MRTELFDVVDRLIDEELHLYRELDVLVDTEELRVNESDMEGLLRVLEEKQAVISRQETLLEQWSRIAADLGVKDGREGPAFWNAVATSAGENGYSQITRKIDDIRELGQRLLDREKVIRQNLEGRLAEMRQSLVNLRRNRAAIHGYSQNAGVY